MLLNLGKFFKAQQRLAEEIMIKNDFLASLLGSYLARVKNVHRQEARGEKKDTYLAN